MPVYKRHNVLVYISRRDGQLIRAKKLDKEAYFRELGLEVPEEEKSTLINIEEVSLKREDELIEFRIRARIQKIRRVSGKVWWAKR